jgi:hypothetical protein
VFGICFEHDGAPPHFGQQVREYLNRSYSSSGLVVVDRPDLRGHQVTHPLTAACDCTWCIWYTGKSANKTRIAANHAVAWPREGEWRNYGEGYRFSLDTCRIYVQKGVDQFEQ